MHLGARRVVAPGGTVWRVGRRWLPDLWRPRLRGRWRRRKDNYDNVDVPRPERSDTSGLDIVDVFEGGLIIGAVLLVVVVLTAFLLPLVILAVELVVLVLVAGAGLAGRVISQRPWVVRARSDDGREEAWNVVGFRASGARRDAIARELEATGRCGGWDSNPHVLADTGT